MKNTNNTNIVLENELKGLKEKLHLIPEPTYIHKVGTEVISGSLKDVVVEEVLEGGKLYKLDFTNFDNNYGNPILTPHQKKYAIWTSVRKKVDNTESFIKNEDVKFRFMQERIISLILKTYDSGVDFEPDYQRDYVWDMKDKIFLIDSIFKNVDIGKFVFIFKGYSKEILYEILDGKQRLRAILDYYEDRFAYKGKFFSDLSFEDQHHFVGYSVATCEVGDLTEEQILRYFLCLNTSGKAMSKKHLNKIKNRLKKVQEKMKNI